MFRVFSVALLIAVCIADTAHAQWEKMTESYSGSNWCFAINGSNLFAGTSAGIFLSSDNGISWKKANVGMPVATDVQALAIHGTNIFAGARNGGIFRSMNNGTSWAVVNTAL